MKYLLTLFILFTYSLSVNAQADTAQFSGSYDIIKMGEFKSDTVFIYAKTAGYSQMIYKTLGRRFAPTRIRFWLAGFSVSGTTYPRVRVGIAGSDSCLSGGVTLSQLNATNDYVDIDLADSARVSIAPNTGIRVKFDNAASHTTYNMAVQIFGGYLP